MCSIICKGILFLSNIAPLAPSFQQSKRSIIRYQNDFVHTERVIETKYTFLIQGI